MSKIKPISSADVRNTTRRMGVDLAGQMPVIEHVRAGHEGRLWRVWMSYDSNFENGLYLELWSDGSVKRCVSHNGKLKSVAEIMPARAK